MYESEKRIIQESYQLFILGHRQINFENVLTNQNNIDRIDLV